jgi:hypothetical protein
MRQRLLEKTISRHSLGEGGSLRQRLFKITIHMSHCRKYSTILLLILLSGCLNPSVPKGRILVKNDSQDREYNVISVSASGMVKSLKPGEFFVLPAQTRNFSVSRRYKDYTRSYSVSCPPVKGRGLFIKTIDIHLDKIAGGCKLLSASR